MTATKTKTKPKKAPLSVLDALPRPRVTVPIFRRLDIAEEIQQLEAELRAELAAQSRGGGMLEEKPRHQEILDRIAALEAEAVASVIKFTFEEIGRRAWRDLETEHPPTEEQLQSAPAFQRPRHNPDTFRPVAMAASCVLIEGFEDGPYEGADAEWFATIGDRYGESAFDLLWSACLDANAGAAVLPKSELASRIRASSEPKLAPRSD